MKTIAHFFSRFMALIVLAVAALALFVPSSGLWISLKAVNYLLMVVMFGMGLTMKLDDFKVVFTQPKDVLIGCLAQFTVMPLLAFSLGKIFGLEAGLLAGVILVGTCPGGTSSNVITYMSKGNVALSVGMTSVNTLLSPIVTPAITYLLLRTSVKVDMLAMCLSILQVVILPIALGFVVNKFAKKFVAKVIDILPVVSVIAICLIVSTVVSQNFNDGSDCFCRRHFAQPFRLCLWIWPWQSFENGHAEDEGPDGGNRHAEFWTCDIACKYSVPEPCHGDGSWRHLFRLA